MIMMTTGQIPEHRAVGGAVMAMAMIMKMPRVRRTHRAVRKGLGKGSEQRTGRGKGKGRRWEPVKGKETVKGREMVKGKVLLNEPQGQMISLVLLLCRCRSKCQRQTWPRRGN
jgi:hypothetical protein